MQVKWPDDKVHVYRVMKAMAILRGIPVDEYLVYLVYRQMESIADTGGMNVYAVMKERLGDKDKKGYD
jgi:hypothetical protein